MQVVKPKFNPLANVGKTFGFLKVLEYLGTRKDSRGKKASTYQVHCVCGNIFPVKWHNLREQKSCGCKRAHTPIVIKPKQRFYKLITVKPVKPEKGITRWQCQCDCGNIVLVTASSLKAGQKSCGCIKIVNHDTPHGKRPGESGKRKLYSKYKNAATHRNKEFDISFDDFIRLTSDDCHYCGISPFLTCTEGKLQKSREFAAYKYNGLDRKDSTKGYTLDNVLTCCHRCNSAKNNMSYEEFQAWVKRVFAHQVKNDI